MPTLAIPDADPRQVRADRVVARTFFDTLGRDYPGQWTDNRFQQSYHYRGIVYIALQAKINWLGSAKISVLERQRRVSRKPVVRKAMRSPSQGMRDEEFHEVPYEHPLARLFRYINPIDTFPQFIAQCLIQQDLTGNLLIWTPFNEHGRPCQMWVLPTALCNAIPPSGYTQSGTPIGRYPDGAWRVNLAAAGGYMPVMGPLGAVGCILDSREVLHYRVPHPLSKWDGYSPLTALAREVDAYDAVQESRISAFNNGSTPDLAVTLKGAGQDEIDRFGADYKNRHTGSKNHRRVIVSNAEDVHVESLNSTPKEMDFLSSWEQTVKAAQAGLGVLAGTTGMVDASSYAAFYASRQQMLTSTIRPWANGFGCFLTKHMAEPWFGEELRIEVDPGSVDDHELQEKQIDSDARNNAITVNEIRGIRNHEPWPDGDEVPAIYLAKKQQEIAPEPDPIAMMGGGADAEEVGADPLAALMGGGGEESGPSRPENPQGKGSLPPRMGKAFRARDLELALDELVNSL